MAQASRLLLLPREVRDEILITVLQTPEKPPSPRESLDARKAAWRFGFQCTSEEPLSPRRIYNLCKRMEEYHLHYRRICFPLETRPAYISLLQCNRQVNIEVRELFDLQQRDQPLIHRLDCVLQDLTLFPNWVMLPTPPQTMQHLEMDLRLFDVDPGPAFLWGDGGPGMMFEPLFELLNRFVHHGYHFFYTQPFEHRIQLESLTINMLYIDSEMHKTPENIGIQGRKLFKKEKARKKVLEEKDHQKLREKVEKERKRIFSSIAGHLRVVATLGLLTGKISKIGIRYGALEETFATDRYEPSEEVSEEWRMYGFCWGIESARKHPCSYNPRAWSLPEKGIVW